ncbi:unnamed protein product [Pleuronectes platessa]|uniref:Uncharacterized protein n=1 Tax=Pleuronectes platessa TaxID=8262 RepID=A0A9N7UC71_PLEPL|nr:unnamed protein product [Pleuronectes platessa]
MEQLTRAVVNQKKVLSHPGVVQVENRQLDVSPVIQARERSLRTDVSNKPTSFLLSLSCHDVPVHMSQFGLSVSASERERHVSNYMMNLELQRLSLLLFVGGVWGGVTAPRSDRAAGRSLSLSCRLHRNFPYYEESRASSPPLRVRLITCLLISGGAQLGPVYRPHLPAAHSAAAMSRRPFRLRTHDATQTSNAKDPQSTQTHSSGLLWALRARGLDCLQQLISSCVVLLFAAEEDSVFSASLSLSLRFNPSTSPPLSGGQHAK